jgi:hypothetical protein
MYPCDYSWTDIHEICYWGLLRKPFEKLQILLKSDNVFVPLLPARLEELLARITEAVATIDADMIHGILEEIAHGWDIYSVTRESCFHYYDGWLMQFTGT